MTPFYFPNAFLLRQLHFELITSCSRQFHPPLSKGPSNISFLLPTTEIPVVGNKTDTREGPLLFSRSRSYIDSFVSRSLPPVSTGSLVVQPSVLTDLKPKVLSILLSDNLSRFVYTNSIY